MEMTIQEVKQLDKNSYQILDIRDDNEIAHGAIPGAVALKVEEIAENPLVDKSKKLVSAAAEENTVRKWYRN